MPTSLTDVGIGDVKEKWIIVCRPYGARGPLYSLLWRTEGPRGKPLPEVGSTIAYGGRQLRVERIDPPGSLTDINPPGSRTLVVKQERK